MLCALPFLDIWVCRINPEELRIYPAKSLAGYIGNAVIFRSEDGCLPPAHGLRRGGWSELPILC